MSSAAAASTLHRKRRSSSPSLDQLRDFCDEVDRQIETEEAAASGPAATSNDGVHGPHGPPGPQDSGRSASSSRSNILGASRASYTRATAAVGEWVDDQDRYWEKNQPDWVKKFRRVVQKFRLISGRIVNDERVQLLIVIMICVNAIMMGIATFDFVRKNPDLDAAFEKTDRAFLIIFTIELGMQFIYHGFKLFLDGWLVFDFAIIVLSWAFASAQIIRAFRIFRALRLITRVEVMRNLVTALFSVMPRMAAIGLLLFLVFYIFAVMFTTLFKSLWKDGLTEWDYFGRLDATFFTLFQIMTLDEWSAVAREVMYTYSWAWAPFVVFVIISGFVVVNLIIAVICDAISALHDDARAMLHGQNFDSELESESQAGGAAGGSPRSADGSRNKHRRHSLNHSAGEMSSEVARAQIASLEKQLEDLVRAQEQSMKTLVALSQHVETSSSHSAPTETGRF
mmetsp:Transcript_30880/g.67767  ORF Transcript_30880/g.67767 Transcript_30880/m.67767 type:complete len:454 (+) Transcript_30880:56-1417(+)